MREVILAHGLWVPGVVMRPLAARLERAGFRCHTFSYYGRRAAAAGARRAPRAHRARYRPRPLSSATAWAAWWCWRRSAGIRRSQPAASCCSARRRAAAMRAGASRAWPAGRWFLGESEHLWREGRTARWTRPEALGVVAGTLPLGLGRLFGRLPGVNDGVVCLEETEVEGMAGRAVLPVGHSAMLVSSRVARECRPLPRRRTVFCESSLVCLPHFFCPAARRSPTTRRRSTAS